MQRYTRVASLIFGVMMLVLSAAVTLETLLRKLFSFSLGGVDELSGYAIALGAPLAFAVALLERSHIRINLLYLKLAPKRQAMLDAAAVLSLGALAVFLLFFTVQNVLDTRQYQSIAQTPWATPLIYPQALWLIAMLAFALPAVWLMLQVLNLLARRDWEGLRKRFGPESTEDELKAELDDLQRR
ncbi:TRAP transporter small permease subunit [Rhodoferax saidenbachensis]|uniref:TRAP transporter small permease protein n=1 Tax=Rhodoferax saidenbachensis TaxID=1484693 RepID=A0A1P8K5Y0_9BURK|nr:TRAP transporter small permease [Rhodoferax saidenbachensis]APW41434.1 C4-dicarboxylate ABC transporter substrate-binding protein [Rhodoferax saidenbachensis]